MNQLVWLGQWGPCVPMGSLWNLQATAATPQQLSLPCPHLAWDVLLPLLGNDLSLLLLQTNRKGNLVSHMRSPGTAGKKEKKCLNSFSDLSCFLVIGLKNSEFGYFLLIVANAKRKNGFIATSFLQRLFSFQACAVQARSQGSPSCSPLFLHFKSGEIKFFLYLPKMAIALWGPGNKTIKYHF